MTGAERQASYIARLKARAAHADVLALRLAAIEALPDARLQRHDARQAVGSLGHHEPSAERSAWLAQAKHAERAAHRAQCGGRYVRLQHDQGPV